MKKNEIGDLSCKSEVHNNNVFEHFMQQFFKSQNLESTPPSPKLDDVVADPTLLEQLAQEAVDARSEEAVDRLLEEDTLAQWVKEARENRKYEI